MAKRNPIEITFYFNTIEEAIATLGSLVQKAAPVANLEKPAQPLVIETKVTKPRKPRADAGQKRGPYKNVEAPGSQAPLAEAGASAGGVNVKDAEGQQTLPPVASTPETAASGSAQSTTADAQAITVPAPGNGEPQAPTQTATPVSPGGSAAPTEAEVQAAIDKVFSAKGLKAAMAALDGFGVKRGRDLKPEDRAAFIQKAEEIANG